MNSKRYSIFTILLLLCTIGITAQNQPVGVILETAGDIQISSIDGKPEVAKPGQEVYQDSLFFSNSWEAYAFVVVGSASDTGADRNIVIEYLPAYPDGLGIELTNLPILSSDKLHSYKEALGGKTLRSSGEINIPEGVPEGAMPITPGGIESFFMDSINSGINLLFGLPSEGFKRSDSNTRLFPVSSLSDVKAISLSFSVPEEEITPDKKEQRTFALSPADNGFWSFPLNSETLPEGFKSMGNLILLLNVSNSDGSGQDLWLNVRIASNSYLDFLKMSIQRSTSDPVQQSTRLNAALLSEGFRYAVENGVVIAD